VDPLKEAYTDESEWIKNSVCPLNRGILFDIDDDIVIVPNFVNRKGANSALVIHSYAFKSLVSQIIQEDKSQASIRKILEMATELIEEGPT
jgi:hypothetical protein